MWREVRRTLGAEWLKLRHSRGTLVGLLLYTVLVLILYITFEIAAARSFIGILSGFYVAGAAISAAVTPLAFVSLLAGTFSIGREFSQGTISNVWTRPLSRGSWLAGKILTVAGIITVFFVITVIALVAIAGFRLGYVDLMEKDYLIYASSSLWWRFLLALLLTWLGLIAIGALAAIPAMYMGSPGGALTAALGVGFVMQIMGGWDLVQPFLITSYVSLPLDQFVAMTKGVPLPEEWGSLIRMCLIGTTIWILLGGWWARHVVFRKEVV